MVELLPASLPALGENESKAALPSQATLIDLMSDGKRGLLAKVAERLDIINPESRKDK